MKRIFYILFLSLGMLFNSCEDLLDRTPLDQISDPQFWKSEGDMQLYINGLYDTFLGWKYMGSGGNPLPDCGTDLVICGGNYQDTKNRIDGIVNVPTSAGGWYWTNFYNVPTAGGGWYWTNVRNVNYFLENVDRVAAGGLKDQYAGEGYFFRAWFYFELLKQFGDLPIVTKALSPKDEEILYGSRSSRTDVVNFIIRDLDIAISKMKKKSEVAAGRLHKDVALLFKSRVCLYEGTWEKYHAGTPFAGKTDGTAFLNLAAQAAKTVIDAGNFSLVQGNHKTVYYELFNKIDYSSNPEVLLWKQYNRLAFGSGTGNVGNQMWNWPHASGYTREMIRMYLCTDGLPILLSPLYKGDGDLRDVVVNRDPRCIQTIMNPGDAVTIGLKNDTTFFVTPVLTGVLCPTGYESQKYRLPKLDPATGSYSEDMGYIFFRYAEALLNYAEARAELGQLTQADVDMTINKLRQRVGMPNLVLSSIPADPAWLDYGYTIPPYLHEVRRERAVEMVAEGHRFHDLMRWRAHNLITDKRPRGTKYTDELKKVNSKLKQDTEGYFDPYTGILNGSGGQGYGFNPEKHYLLPLPINELTLNENLKQNPGY